MSPLAFGPSTLPPVTTVEGQSTTVVSFVTDREAAQRVLPPYFCATEVPVVSYMHQELVGVDYMHGRGYNLVNVAISAVYEGEVGVITGLCPVVIWESHTMPIIAGRELHGNPKIYGEVSALDVAETAVSFECREYGGLLLEGVVDTLRPVDTNRLARVNEGAGDSRIFGWKQIPGTAGPDADYPTLIHGSSVFDQAWSGRGRLTLCTPSLAEAPYSAPVLTELRALPQVEWRPGFYGVGRATLFRDRTERLR